MTYSTWGTPTVTTVTGYGNLGFRYLYVGRFDVQWDDFASAGLLYMHARHYHPEFGRFLQPDPSALETNLYAYAENSPVTKVDPSGTCWKCMLDKLIDYARRAGEVLARWAPTVGRFSFRLTTSTRKQLIDAAQRIDYADKAGQLTRAGRALEKHGGRLGNNYPLALGNAASKNAQGLRVLQSILNNVARIETKPIPGRFSFGHYIDIYGTNGLIARFSQPARGPLMFIGFRD